VTPMSEPPAPLRRPRNPEDAAETELSAGGAVFRRSERGIELVLGHQTDWNTGASTMRLPKGHVEAGETLEEAALREVREETGRHARIVEKLDECHYAYENLATGEAISKRVVFFLMEDVGDASEARDDEMNEVEWMSAERAIAALTFDNEREIAKLAAVRLDGGAAGV
jgi:8-oxo-dGTP pyrophosphatase MutT (NUDIX family)